MDRLGGGMSLASILYRDKVDAKAKKDHRFSDLFYEYWEKITN
jgi:hypothetical protein